MNFTQKVKEEIINKIPNVVNKEVQAFLSGFIRSSGVIIKQNNSFGFEVSSQQQSVIEVVVNLLYSVYGVQAEKEIGHDLLNKQDRYYAIYLGEKAINVLTRLDILDAHKNNIILNADLNTQVLNTIESKRAFIQGTFIGSGIITIPSKSNSKKTTYHLEVVFTHHDSAFQFLNLLSTFEIFASLIERKKHYVVYVKRWEEITDFLAILNANNSLNEVISIKASRDMINHTNRVLNCDMHNADKQLGAFLKQTKAIQVIKDTIGLDSLDADLKKTALLRLEHCEYSLQELATELNITKSGVNHRLNKLIEIAKTLS